MGIADLPPGEHAKAVRDHWWWRPGWRVGRRFYAFHLTFTDCPELHHLAEQYRSSLRDLSTVTLVPDRWLHLTMQGVGFADEVRTTDLRGLARRVAERMTRTPAFGVRLGDIVVGDEAVAMPATPEGPLRALRQEVRAVVGNTLGDSYLRDDPARYRPHVSVAYMTTAGPPDPYLDAVGAVRPTPAEIRIHHVDLIAMHRDHFMYEWDHLDAFALG